MKKTLLFLLVTFFFIVSISAQTGEGIKSTNTDSLISNAYPNPAFEIVNIDYKLPINVTKAKIRVSNLLGLTITNIDLVNNSGKTTINVSEFKNGIYFYSLMINNTPTTTRKFVVRR